MDARDLRIGNWVSNIHDIPMIVKAIYEDTVYVDFKGNVGGLWEFNKHEPFKPIELTEEILLKCGFIPCSIIENNFNIKGMCIWKCNDMFLCDKNGVHIKHFHQLQNLFYALTNEELNVQL